MIRAEDLHDQIPFVPMAYNFVKSIFSDKLHFMSFKMRPRIGPHSYSLIDMLQRSRVMAIAVSKAAYADRIASAPGLLMVSVLRL